MELSSIYFDRIIRGVMLDKASKAMRWSLTQIRDGSLEGTSESQQVVDYLNAPIAELDRAKTLTFSGTNAMFDLKLLAAQFGSETNASSATKTFIAPAMEEFTVTYGSNGDGTVTLAHTPAGTGAAAIPYIYELDGARNAIKKYDYSSTATASAFTFSGKTLTYPTDLISESKTEASFLVIYEYAADETDQAIEAVNYGDSFPTAGVFLVEALFRDICDQQTCYYGYIEMPNAKLDSNFTVNLAADADHPFSIRAFQDYCSTQKKLCRVIIPEAISDAV